MQWAERVTCRGSESCTSTQSTARSSRSSSSGTDRSATGSIGCAPRSHASTVIASAAPPPAAANAPSQRAVSAASAAAGSAPWTFTTIDVAPSAAREPIKSATRSAYHAGGLRPPPPSKNARPAGHVNAIEYSLRFGRRSERRAARGGGAAASSRAAAVRFVAPRVSRRGPSATAARFRGFRSSPSWRSISSSGSSCGTSHEANAASGF